MVSQDQEPAPPPQNKGKGGNNARRRSVSPPSQSDTRSISSSLASYMRMNGPVFQPQQHRLSARERGTRGVSRDKIQLAPLPEQVAAIVQQLQKPPPSVLPTQPFRLPPPSGALGMQLQRASPSSSPERQQRTEEPVSAPNLHFSWDSDFEQYLRGRVGQTGGFIRAMSESPASPGAVFEPTERSSVIWFRDNYPEPPPAHRRDVFAVQQWLEGQMQKLGRSLQQQGLLQKQQGPHKQAGPTQQPRQQQQPSPQQQQQPQQQQPQQQQQEQKQQLQQQASRVRDENQSQQGEQEQQQEHGQSEQGEDEREQGSENGDQQQDAQEPPSQAPASPTSQPPRAATDNGQGCPTQRRPSSSILSGSYTLSDDGRSSVQVARDSDGFLSTDVLIHQEKLFTRSMEELCGQAATLCVERGHLMWQMWAALRHMLRLVLQDRETSRAITREARRSELSVKGSVEAEKAVAKAEMEEVTHMNEVLNRRVLSRQAEIDQLRAKVTELEIHIASQANFNPALLQQQIEELQINVSISERQVQNLNAKLETVQRDFTEAQKEVSYLTNKLSEARSDYTSMASRLAVRTPRPSQPRMPPWELIKEEESHLTQQALREGCSPKDMHRLLLGVSFNNCNILPWVNNFMGCCRNWTPAAKGAGEEGAGGMAEAQDIADETMSIAPSRAGMGSSHSRGPSAVMHSRAGSIAAGGSTKSGTRKSKFLQPMLPPIKDLQPQLSRLLATQNVTRMQKSLPSEVVQAVSQMANHGVDPDSMACLLLGSVSPDGLELTPYKSLAGILSKRFGGTADDIGGPMTEALVMASMSTRERMEHVENQLLLKHRMAVKYRRAIAEQRKQTEDMKEQELKQQSRKIMRTPHPLTHLLSQKRCEYFVGLGTDPSVPQVLQFEGKVYCRTLEKAEAERTVHTIWRSKREFEGTHNINVTLPDYLYIFLQRKFSKAQTLSEAAYNLLYSLSKHMYDPDCSIFLKVLMNEVGEDIREQQDGLKSTFLEALKHIDEETNVKATGWLLKNDMRAGLRKSFQNKTEHQMVELFDALDSDEPRELVNYFRLFDSDNDLNQGVFAETIRQQHLNEQMAFYQSIEDAILDQVEKNGNDACTPQMLSTAFKKTHPHMSSEEVDVYQRRVFPSKNEKDKGKKASVPLDEALGLLRTPHMTHLVDLNTALDISRKGGAARAASPSLQIWTEKGGENTEQQEQGKEANEVAPENEENQGQE